MPSSSATRSIVSTRAFTCSTDCAPPRMASAISVPRSTPAAMTRRSADSDSPASNSWRTLLLNSVVRSACSCSSSMKPLATLSPALVNAASRSSAPNAASRVALYISSNAARASSTLRRAASIASDICWRSVSAKSLARSSSFLARSAAASKLRPAPSVSVFRSSRLPLVAMAW